MQQPYSPGHSRNATDFMANRTLESHGQFFAAYLSAGVSVLDCGCGPGTITVGLAEKVRPGRVVGVDIGNSQIARALATAAERGVKNLNFQVADCYSLPFDDESFDRIFCHALIEHLPEPVRGLMELHRVLKPGGLVGICSPDWGGFVLAPPSQNLARAVAAYESLQRSNGGDVQAGRKLGVHLEAAGFGNVEMSARYECYSSLASIAEYLAIQLVREGEDEAGETLRSWSMSAGGLFAQSWISAVGRKSH